MLDSLLENASKELASLVAEMLEPSFRDPREELVEKLELRVFDTVLFELSKSENVSSYSDEDREDLENAAFTVAGMFLFLFLRYQ